MNYKRLAVFFIMVLILCGCTTSGEDEPASILSADSVQEDEADQDVVDLDVVQEEEQPEDGAMRDTPEEAVAYTYYEQAVLDMENGEIVYCPDDYYHWITSAAGTKEMLLVMVKSNNELRNNNTLIAIDRDGKILGEDGEEQDSSKYMVQEIETISGFLTSSNLGYYQGKWYLQYQESGRNSVHQYCVYCYEQQEDGTFLKSQDTLCETIMELYGQGYRFCGKEQDVFTCLNEQGLLLFWKGKEEAVVAAFEIDGTLCWEYPIDSSIRYIDGTDGRFVIGRAINDSLSDPEGTFYKYDYLIYDCAGTDANSGPIEMKNSNSFYLMGVYDGYVYYWYMERQGYNIDAYKVVRCCLDPLGEEELLYESVDGPGLDVNIMPGIDGFAVKGDFCYFVNFDDGSLWWCTCDLVDETHPLARLGLLDDYRGMFDVGEVSYENIDFFCPKCGTLIGTYYAEQICLSEEVVPHADVINQVLLGNPDYCAEEMSQYYADQDVIAELEAECDAGFHHVHTGDIYSVDFDGVTQYCFHKAGQEEELICLEVDYSVYEYSSGAAHGYTTISHYFFDLSDGSEITVGDIMGVSEEEFRTLAAEYTLADCQKDNSRYFYDENGYRNGNSLYDMVYEGTGFDSRMYFSEDGVVMEYAPYYLGGYAQGYIRVTIPYDELGLELLDIYGVKKNR